MLCVCMSNTTDLERPVKDRDFFARFLIVIFFACHRPKSDMQQLAIMQTCVVASAAFCLRQWLILLLHCYSYHDA